jgi:site-specific recombinase XerD
MARIKNPLPLFDSLKEINETVIKFSLYENINRMDVTQTLAFLKSYQGSAGTFNTYRREVERLLQWCLNIAGKSLKKLKRDDIEKFLHFCQKPPKSWVGITKAPRFITQDGLRVPNPKWRPFVSTVTKAAHSQGAEPNTNEFILSHGSIKESFAILSSFFNYLLQEEYVKSNPVAMIRQKSQFIRTSQQKSKIRRLSELQWQTVMETAEVMAEENSEQERTLFMLSILYSMYLRISELAASERWIPAMNDFQQDSNGHWWFTTVGKGNKQRQIAVSDSMLTALKRWRKHLNLSGLPSPADNTVLLPKTKGIGSITSTNYIRCIIQSCFDRAIESLRKNGHKQEAESLMEATVHWLRHTGISDDVKRRPREHVRDDAGHSSGSTTDKYIDIELQERHKSAKNKLIVKNNKPST